MQERYLFKAKRIDTGEWVFGGLSQCAETGAYFITNMGKDHISYIGYHQEVDPDTICQCTGLNKNGNLIWENDIVKDLFSDTAAPIRYGSYQSCFDSTNVEHVGFYVDWSGTRNECYRKDLGYWINMVDAEIIGNTFDNPELLEDSHDGE